MFKLNNLVQKAKSFLDGVTEEPDVDFVLFGFVHRFFLKGLLAELRLHEAGFVPHHIKGRTSLSRSSTPQISLIPTET